MRLLLLCTPIVLFGFTVTTGAAQGPSATPDPATTYCDFSDGNQVTVQYSKSAGTRDSEPRDGRVWQPGGSAMILYAQTPLTLGSSQIPIGAFSLYVIPSRKQWTLIVNKNVSAGAKYDEKDDLARAPMEVGEIADPVKPAQVSFAHTSPKGCSLQIYYGKVGAFGSEFREQ